MFARLFHSACRGALEVERGWNPQEELKESEEQRYREISMASGLHFGDLIPKGLLGYCIRLLRLTKLYLEDCERRYM